VLHDMRQTEVAWPAFDLEAVEEDNGGTRIRAPINGRLVKVFASAGAEVARGERIAVVEAMKMEHVLSAPRAGKIARLSATEGQQVTQGTVIAELAEG
jgi:3-methylcrotonyl-CoA carboxylase alpha subunit